MTVEAVGIDGRPATRLAARLRVADSTVVALDGDDLVFGFDALRAAGARLLSFNPVNPLEARGGAWRPNRRDHRKIAVVDGRVAMTGGINLDHVYENSCRRAA